MNARAFGRPSWFVYCLLAVILLESFPCLSSRHWPACRYTMKRVQKAGLIGMGIRLNLLQRALAYEKRCLDRAIVSPEPHGAPRMVV
jgi:hypothetical protein